MKETNSAGQKFEKLVEILETLRGQDGCSWDKAQDENSITDFFLEEVYEAVDALAREDILAFKEELGDVMMEIIFLARIFKEKRAFDISDVLDGINAKMIQRHPHVFEKKTDNSEKRVIKDWTAQKTLEKERTSVFDGFVQNLPSLLSAFQIGQKVSVVGFDWSNLQDVLDKVKEELSELEKAMEGDRRQNIRQEVGDLLFASVNLARHLGVNAELALRGTNQKFIKRFQYIEKKLRAKGKTVTESTLDEMDRLWEEAKGQNF